MDQASKTIERRALATKFHQVFYYSTASTLKLYDKLAPGIYKIAAEGAEVYVIDGQPSELVASQWSRIEPGDFDLWECRESGESLSVYCSVGAAVRITLRHQG